MEEPYKNRELDEKFEELKVIALRIEAQTTKTNGRVGSLEVWRGFITGGLAILTILIIPIAFKILWP